MLSGALGSRAKTVCVTFFTLIQGCVCVCVGERLCIAHTFHYNPNVFLHSAICHCTDHKHVNSLWSLIACFGRKVEQPWLHLID